MKQLVIVSGKGGTGKTTVCASFAALAANAGLADCDVDAANLYLLLHPEDETREDFLGARIAVRDERLCTHCGACEPHCRFEAITSEAIHETSCEGCGLCVKVCPRGALRLEAVVNGTIAAGRTRFGLMVHARLRPAGENSGRLVTRVRQEAETAGAREHADIIIIDGPPGIGCSATAAMVDADLALIVTEPSLSGMHDMERIAQLAQRLRIPIAAIINKADINPANTEAIIDYCADHHIPVLAQLPYDPVVVAANAAQIPLTKYDKGPVAAGIRLAWQRVCALITDHNATTSPATTARTDTIITER